MITKSDRNEIELNEINTNKNKEKNHCKSNECIVCMRKKRERINEIKMVLNTLNIAMTIYSNHSGLFRCDFSTKKLVLAADISN